MSGRFKNTFYAIEKLQFIKGELRYVENEDGTLFSGPYRTKIKPSDLPEWYLYGRYYKRFGYMSTKGIADMVYVPNHYSNHFLKDDFLLISYGGTITEIPNPELYVRERFNGWDEYVWSSEIVTILRGARKYSGYDIAPFIEKLKWKREYLLERFPNDYGVRHLKEVDVDQYFATE